MKFPKFHAIPEGGLGWNAAEIETGSLWSRITLVTIPNQWCLRKNTSRVLGRQALRAHSAPVMKCLHVPFE